MNNYNNLNNNMNKINDKNLMIVNYNSNQQKDSNSRRKSKFDIMNDENSLINNNTLKSDSQNSNGLQVSQTSTEINNQQKEFIQKESLENMPVGIMATIINQQKKAVLYQF